MRGRGSWVAIAWALALLVGGSGCASVKVVKPRAVASHRSGLFDQLQSRRPAAIWVEGSTPGSFDSEDPGEFKKLGLVWPLRMAEVTSPFGQRGHEFHEGVDLKAAVGTPVFAAQEGRVIYSGARIRGYGRMVVVRHDQGVITIYAHNSRLLVRYGQKVRRGQRIAVSGRSGKVTGPHLHFEVRNGEKAVDPVEVMNQRPRNGAS